MECSGRVGRKIDSKRKWSRRAHHVRSFYLPETQVRFAVRGNETFDLFLVERQSSSIPVDESCSCLCRHNIDLITYALVEIEVHARRMALHASTLMSSDIVMPRT